jgi:Peptidoglycan-binding protein, CsiV
MKILIRALLLLSLTSIAWAQAVPTAATATPPAPTLYKVEVIVFSHLSPQAYASEAWPVHPALPTLTQSTPIMPADSSDVLLTGAPVAAVPYQYLPSSDFQLTQTEKRLAANPQYQVLTHLAWLQPLAAKRVTVHISGEPLTDNAQNNLNDFKQWGVNGTLTLSKTNYVNLRTNLWIQLTDVQLQKAGISSSAQTREFRLAQKRRLRNNEIHYLDHPLFGIIVKVTPQPPALA